MKDDECHRTLRICRLCGQSFSPVRSFLTPMILSLPMLMILFPWQGNNNDTSCHGHPFGVKVIGDHGKNKNFKVTPALVRHISWKWEHFLHASTIPLWESF